MLRRFGEIPVASLYPILSFDDKMFLSPRGDKLQAAMEKGLKYRFTRFPSPRGDKLQPVPAPAPDLAQILFPSPRGDKLQHFPRGGMHLPFLRFRPLAGISCNCRYMGYIPNVYMFPSPRGDKLQRLWGVAIQQFKNSFPSPHGDKLQQQNCMRQSCCFLQYSTKTAEYASIKTPMICCTWGKNEVFAVRTGPSSTVKSAQENRLRTGRKW